MTRCQASDVLLSISGGPWHHSLCAMLLLTPSDIPLVCDVSANSKACSGPDVGFLIGSMVIALILLWCVYCAVERDSRAKRRDSFALLSIVCSQLVSLFQMLGVLNALSVVWPEPFATIVKLGTITNFRLEVLNLGCVLSTPPLHRYTANVFMFVPLTLCMVCCHFVHTMVFHFDQFTRAHFQQFASTLFGAVGTVFMSIFISVCSAIAQPLQCDMHPNGVSTMQAYRQVTCWDPESEHQHMLTIGALASLVPWPSCPCAHGSPTRCRGVCVKATQRSCTLSPSCCSDFVLEPISMCLCCCSGTSSWRSCQ